MEKIESCGARELLHPTANWTPLDVEGWVPVEEPAMRQIAWDYSSRYQVEVRLTEEPDGGFSVHAPALPGLATEGDTEREAIDNAREALIGLLQCYQAHNEPIPWRTEDGRPETEGISHWIVVDA